MYAKEINNLNGVGKYIDLIVVYKFDVINLIKRHTLKQPTDIDIIEIAQKKGYELKTDIIET